MSIDKENDPRWDLWDDDQRAMMELLWADTGEGAPERVGCDIVFDGKTWKKVSLSDPAPGSIS